MQKDVASFYKTPEWKSAREACLKKAGGLCEECLKKGLITPATIVHHRVHMNAKTITDPKLRSGLDNLEALCVNCHAAAHSTRLSSRRYSVDAMGHVIGRD